MNDYAIPATYCKDRLVPIETVQAVIAELYQMAASFTSDEEFPGSKALGDAVLQLEKHCAFRMKN